MLLLFTFMGACAAALSRNTSAGACLSSRCSPEVLGCRNSSVVRHVSGFCGRCGCPAQARAQAAGMRMAWQRERSQCGDGHLQAAGGVEEAAGTVPPQGRSKGAHSPRGKPRLLRRPRSILSVRRRCEHPGPPGQGHAGQHSGGGRTVPKHRKGGIVASHIIGGERNGAWGRR